MAIARIPDVGAGPERQGPRPALTAVQINAVRALRRSGATVTELAVRYEVSPRTILRYLAGTDDRAFDVTAAAIAEAELDFGFHLTATQREDLAREIVRRLRQTGRIDGRPS